MRTFRDRATGLLRLLPLIVAVSVAGCDSATGPKFPEPEEEEGDSTVEEGMRSVGTAAKSAGHEAVIVALVPSFRPVGAP
jgi:hypothetical protein